MKKNKIIPLILGLFVSFFGTAQTLTWTGAASNNDFFTEGNWINSVTNLSPVAGSIDAGIAITFPLAINNISSPIAASGVITLANGVNINVTAAQLDATGFSGGNVTINQDAYVSLSSATPYQDNVQVNFTSGLAWVKTPNFNARSASFVNGTQFTVNGAMSTYQTNLRLDNYYQNGAIVRANLATTSPLTIYNGLNLQGTSAQLSVNTIHSGIAIPNGLNNMMESFVLKRGFMATFAIENDGTGKSKNFIASEADLVINDLPKSLVNAISFIRVVPWNWVTKKGRNDTGIDLRTSWRYKWNSNELSTVNMEYVPMSWGHGGADDDSDIALYVGKYANTSVMSFNEPDDCNGQSGQWGNLCQTDVAVSLHKNLMKSGLRIISPGGREEAPFGWLKEFYFKATAQDIRIDAIAVHWYDWGSNPTVNTAPTALQVFNRFKAYLTNVYNLYGLPIWITEFNANPARSQAINSGFLALALPYLETLDYIERYCNFPYKAGTDYYVPLGSTTLGPVGITYRDQVSTPAIPEATVNANNNLNLSDYPNVARNKVATASSTFTTFVPGGAIDGNLSEASSKWVANFGVPTDPNFAFLPAWIEVDLQGSFTIDAFRTVEEIRALKNCRFEVWDTTLNGGAGGWTAVVTILNNPATPLTTYRTFPAVTTTKVRLVITGHNSIDYLRLLELEVYGIPNVVLSNNQFSKKSFGIYPNPVNGNFLNISGDQDVDSVEVYSVLGTKMNISYENRKVSVGNLAPGIYFVRINKNESLKFIKK